MSLKCANCEKSIYPNDPQISFDGVAYHKPCAKCADCQCQITLSNFTKDGTTLLCKTHYFKRFHEEGNYLGGNKYTRLSSRDAIRPGTTTTLPESGIVHDEGVVPLAERPTVSVVDRVRTGVTSTETTVPIVTNNDAMDECKTAAESTYSLRTKFEKGATSSGDGSGIDNSTKATKRIPSFSGGGVKCTVCTKTIYANDPQITLDGIKYHGACAKCADCNCQITISNFTKSSTMLLCKTHYFTRFSVSGSYLGGDKYERKADRDTKSAGVDQPFRESSPDVTDTSNVRSEDSTVLEDIHVKQLASAFEHSTHITDDTTVSTGNVHAVVKTSEEHPTVENHTENSIPQVESNIIQTDVVLESEESC